MFGSGAASGKMSAAADGAMALPSSIIAIFGSWGGWIIAIFGSVGGWGGGRARREGEGD